MKTLTLELLRWLAVAGALVLLLVLGGRDKISQAEPQAVEQAVVQCLDMDQMQQADNQMIKRLYGLAPGDFEGCVLYYPTTNMGAEELLIVKLADVSQQQAVAQAIERRLETQKASFDGYGIAQYDLLTNHAVTELRGNYVLFVVSARAEEARAAFLAAL